MQAMTTATIITATIGIWAVGSGVDKGVGLLVLARAIPTNKNNEGYFTLFAKQNEQTALHSLSFPKSFIPQPLITNE